MTLVNRSVILKSLEHLYLSRGLEYYSGNGGNHMTFVSGQSRAGNIEQVSVVEAHGRKETRTLILDSD